MNDVSAPPPRGPLFNDDVAREAHVRTGRRFLSIHFVEEDHLHHFRVAQNKRRSGVGLLVRKHQSRAGPEIDPATFTFAVEVVNQIGGVEGVVVLGKIEAAKDAF